MAPHVVGVRLERTAPSTRALLLAGDTMAILSGYEIGEMSVVFS